eukprot:1142832-Pelagomonas_calceolata.AAC.4
MSNPCLPQYLVLTIQAPQPENVSEEMCVMCRMALAAVLVESSSVSRSLSCKKFEEPEKAPIHSCTPARMSTHPPPPHGRVRTQTSVKVGFLCCKGSKAAELRTVRELELSKLLA